MNRAFVLGNLTRDPEVKFTPQGKAVCKFAVATNKKWTDSDGKTQEKATFHNIVVWGKQAETCGQYLAKGRQVFVEGEIDNRSYDDKDGNKRYISEVIARDVKFLGGRGDGASSGAPSSGDGAAELPGDDDIPW